MDRLIGIDYGKKRTGLAVSDPLRIFSSALDTVDTAKLIDYLKNYAQKETIERFVVGYPVNMDGTPSEAAKRQSPASRSALKTNVSPPFSPTGS